MKVINFKCNVINEKSQIQTQISKKATLVKNKYTVFEIHLFHAKYSTNTFTYLCT